MMYRKQMELDIANSFSYSINHRRLIRLTPMFSLVITILMNMGVKITEDKKFTSFYTNQNQVTRFYGRSIFKFVSAFH